MDGTLLMRGVEDYCNCELSSLGGFALEEPSEQEWNPSIKGSVVRCCPTLRALIK